MRRLGLPWCTAVAVAAAMLLAAIGRATALSGGQRAILFGPPSWLRAAAVNGKLPDPFADFTTEGSADPHYWYAGRRYGSFAAWQAALGVSAFARSTTGTYTASGGLLATASANVARFDYQPLTTLPTLLYEPSATNLVQQAEAFNLTWTVARGTVSANATAAPDGNTTADKIVEAASTGTHAPFQAVALVSGATYELSVSAKAAERTWFAVDLEDGAGTHVTLFDLANGSIGTNSSGNTAVIVALGNGWYRCAVSRIVSGTSGFAQFDLAISDSANMSYAGDSSKGLYLWGANLTVAPLSSYIPSTTGAATRGADSLPLSIPSGRSQVIVTFDEGSTQTISGLSPGSYTPTALSRPNLKRLGVY